MELFKAISENKFQYAIKELSKENSEVDIADFIIKAIRINDEKVNIFLTELVKEEKWQDWADEVFQEACTRKNVSLVSNLLKTNRKPIKLEINRRDRDGRTAFHKLLTRKNKHQNQDKNYVSLVTLFLLNGADVNITDTRGVTPLHLAALAREIDSVRMIVKNQQFNPMLFTLTDIDGKTPLWYAVERGNEEMVTLLLEQENKFRNICSDKSINTTSGLLEGWTVLHKAAKIASDKMCRILLAFGSEVDMRNDSGETALHVALKYSNLPVVEVLLENNASVNAKTAMGMTSLHTAIKYKHQVPNEYIEKLLAQKADANIKDDFGRTPLHVAVESQDQLNQVMDLLIDYGVNVNELNNNLESPLYVSVERENISMVKYLLNKKADPNGSNVNGVTPLHQAAQFNENTEILEALVTHKADINTPDKQGKTPLHYAVNISNVPALKCLLKHGAWVNVSDVSGLTPLHVAISHQILREIVLYLLKYGADLESKTTYGETPLHLILGNIFASNHLDLVKHFLEHTENINAQQTDGDSLLHVALRGSRISGRSRWKNLQLGFDVNVIKLMLEKGADILAKNDMKETPLDIIKRTFPYWSRQIKQLFYTHLIKYRAAEFPQTIDNPIIADLSQTILNTKEYKNLDKSCSAEIKLLKENFVSTTSYYDILKSKTEDIYKFFNNDDIKTLESSVNKLRSLSAHYRVLLEHKIQAIINRLNQIKLLDDAVIFFSLVTLNLGIPAGPMSHCSQEIIKYLSKYELKLLQILLNERRHQ